MTRSSDLAQDVGVVSQEAIARQALNQAQVLANLGQQTPGSTPFTPPAYFFGWGATPVGKDSDIQDSEQAISFQQQQQANPAVDGTWGATPWGATPTYWTGE